MKGNYCETTGDVPNEYIGKKISRSFTPFLMTTVVFGLFIEAISK